MKRVVATSVGLLFGLLTVVMAGEDAPSPSSNNGSGTALGRPTQARSASGVTLGRPIAGRARVEEPPAPTTAPAPAPEPVQQASYDNPSLVMPPALESAAKAPEAETPKKAPEPAAAKKQSQPEVITKTPQRVQKAKPVSVSAKAVIRQKPENLQLTSPDGPEGLPVPAPDGDAVVGPHIVTPGFPDDGGGVSGPCGDCNACSWCDYPAGIRGPLGQWYVFAEYLRWKVRNSQSPPLVTAGPVGDPRGGILGDPATTVLFGGSISHNWQNGFRVGMGYWFDECQSLGVEGSFFMLVPQTTSFTAGNTPGLFIGRPFFDVAPGLTGEAVEEVSGPDTNGTVTVKLNTRLLGADLNLRKNLLMNTGPWGTVWHLDGLAGFRYMQLKESLSIVENLTLLAPVGALNPGDGITVNDQFKTVNNFYGGQLGLDGEIRKGRWFVDLRAKVAVGVTHQRVDINGETQFFQPAGTLVSTQPGGLLALPTNIGGHTHTTFSVVPELGVNLGYQLTDNLRIYAGYTFILWTNVARPGQQIDRTINSNQLPTLTGPGSLGGGPARPAFSIHDTSFWAQGVNLGLEYTW